MDYKQIIVKAYKENKSQNTPYKSFFKSEAQRAERVEFIEPVDFFNGCMFILDQYKNEIIRNYEKYYQENDIVVKCIEVGNGINIGDEHVTDLKDERIIATLDTIKEQKEFIKKRGYKNNLEFSCTLDSMGNIEKSCLIANDHVMLYWFDIEQIEKGIINAKDELIPNKKSKVNLDDNTETVNSLKDLLLCEENIKDNVIAYIKMILGAQTQKNVTLALLTIALEKKGYIMKIQDRSQYHRIVTAEFGEVGTLSGFNSHYGDVEFEKNKIRAIGIQDYIEKLPKETVK